MKDSLDLNLKAAMYTGMVLVGMICLAMVLYCYPWIFPIFMIGSALFVFVSFIFLMVRLGLESKSNYKW